MTEAISNPGADTPTVQVVIPCRDGIPYLAQALDSLRAQSYTNWVLSFVDCGSSDGSRELVTSVLGHDAQVLDAPGATAGEARTLAIRDSDHTLIAFLDADDRWHPRKLETQLALLTSSAVGLVYSDARAIDEEGRTLGSLFQTRRPRGDRCFEHLLDGNFVPLSSVLMRRELFDRAGGFPDGYRIAQDYLLFLRASRLADFDFHPEPLCDYRVRSQSLSADFRATYAENVRLLGELCDEAETVSAAALIDHARRRVLWRWWLREMFDPGRGRGWGAPGREAVRLAGGPLHARAALDLASVLVGGLRGAHVRRRMMRARAVGRATAPTKAPAIPSGVISDDS